jgi:hydroxypyruvate isomerase
MSQVKQSVSWWCFHPKLLTAEALVRTAADLRYAAIELVEPEYWPLIEVHGLQIASMRGHSSIENGLNRRANHTSIIAELRQSIELAAAHHIPNVICFSGNRAGLADDQGAQIVAEALRQVAPIAEKAGVTVVLELLNSKVDHMDYQADHTLWGVQVCKLVDSPNVRLLYDIYHMQITEGDVISTIRQYHPYFAHYHTAGVPGRHEIDGSQELNYPAIARAIAETGYTGYLGQEFIPAGDPVKALREAFALCDV